MSDTPYLRFDETMRAAWVASGLDSRHLDEQTWTTLLEGTLDDETRESTLEHISSCAQCAGVFRIARAAALAELRPAMPPQTRARRLVPELGLAATVAIATLTVVVLREDRRVPAPAAAQMPAPDASSIPAAPPPRLEKPAIVVSSEQLLTTRSRRDNTAYVESLAAALEPYQQDKFKEAARRLAGVATSHPDAFEPAFYLGVSLLLDGKASEAVPVLERARRLASAVRRDEATHYLTLARAGVK